LDEKLIAGEECVVNLGGIFDVVDGELFLLRELIEPNLRGVDKRLVDSAGFGDGHGPETGFGVLCGRVAGGENAQRE